MAKTIVDNLEIKVGHIHIRYEDKVTFQGELFSCGCTLESFVIATTDENWTEKFVDKASKKSKSSSFKTFKLAKSTNFGVYWNIESAEYSGFDYEAWKNVMKNCVVGGGDVDKRAIDSGDMYSMTYIIKPSNYGQLKFIHDERQSVVPQLSLQFESSDLKLHFDKLQMRQSIKAFMMMAAMKDKMVLMKHRPEKSALKEPWAWWAYVLILIARKPDLLEKKVIALFFCNRVHVIVL